MQKKESADFSVGFLFGFGGVGVFFSFKRKAATSIIVSKTCRLRWVELEAQCNCYPC